VRIEALTSSDEPDMLRLLSLARIAIQGQLCLGIWVDRPALLVAMMVGSRFNAG
jgi:hypothetical protein